MPPFLHGAQGSVHSFLPPFVLITILWGGGRLRGGDWLESFMATWDLNMDFPDKSIFQTTPSFWLWNSEIPREATSPSLEGAWVFQFLNNEDELD